MLPFPAKHRWTGVAVFLAAFAALPVSAQVAAVDPDAAIDADLVPAPAADAPVEGDVPSDGMGESGAVPAPAEAPADADVAGVPTEVTSVEGGEVPATASAQPGQTWHKDDLIGAAEGVFGKGARGLAGLIEDLLKKQGEPNAYISGREASGAVVVGLRYGSGTLYHKVEGQMPAYWTGPSVGFDLGANAANTFVLVYNLWDTQDLFHRYVAGEGQAYFIGGFHVSYLRRGDVVLIPVRAGAGLRLGINAGYMKFSKKAKWLPF